MNDLLSLADLTTEEIIGLLDLAADLKAKQHAGEPHRLLEGQTLAMIFEKPSLRTRVTFETGMFQLGGHSLMIHSENSRLGDRETISDVAHNLERWVDGIMARTFSHAAVEELALEGAMPVINGLTDKLHPCQILADALTLREHKGEFDGLKVAFVGDGNNVCASWLNFAARIPIDFALVCPPGYEVDPEILAFAQREGKGTITQTNDVAEGLANADAIYTDVWASMGQEEEAAARKLEFMPYQVNAAAMAHAKSDAIFMHCLPAHRGEEVTADVIDSQQSVVFDEAENRLHAQKAVLVTLMQRGGDNLCPKRRSRK